MNSNENVPPINFDIPDFRFPKYDTESINENLQIIFYEDKSQPLAGINYVFFTGAADEHIDGLAYFTAQLMKRGTTKRTSNEISDEIDRLGAAFSASASWDVISIGITCLKDYTVQALEILSDCICNPAFDSEEIERYKTKHLADIEQELADPSYVSTLSLNRTLFNSHPYGHPLIGSNESISIITKDDCISFHNKIISGGKAFILVSGNFDREIIKTNLLAKTQSINISRNDNKLPKLHRVKSNRIIISNKEDNNQSVLKIGKFSISKESEDYPDLQFINTVFGGSFLSRLNALLREELGYTYGVKSYINPRLLGSSYVVSTSVNKKSTADTVEKIIEQMDLITNNKIEEKEFLLARQYLLGSFVRGLETVRQVSSLIKTLFAGKLSPDHYDKFYSRIKNADIDSLLKVQRRNMKPEGLVISVAGNAKSLEKKLHKFGSIELYDPV